MSTVLTRTLSLPLPPSGESELPRVAQLFCVVDSGSPLRPASRHALDGIDEVKLIRAARRGHQRSHTARGGQLILGIPDPCMSAEHACISRVVGEYQLRDLGSKNGSLINGGPVQSARLRDSDVIQIGQTFLIFRAGIPLSDTEPRDYMISAEQTIAGMNTVNPVLSGQFNDLGRIARTDISVAILGETGTGKELVAHAIHDMSLRTGNFVPINCGALPKDLASSELFGYLKGAFTGATADKLGLIASAHQGTLFLDEIGDLPLEQQVVLLRVLQDRSVTPIGGVTPRKVDFRLVVATHRDIPAALEAGTFREDLWTRASGFVLQLPPLRERREDLGLILGAVLARQGASASNIALRGDATHALLQHGWKGNIRELEQCMKSAMTLCDDGTVTLAALQKSLRAEPAAPPAPDPDSDPDVLDRDPAEALDEQRQDQLRKLLERTSGNLSEVARLMGKGRTQIQRWIKRYGIDAGRYRHT
jgi:transcriptional regulator with PAS, ATPase and Fis domain